MSLSRFFSVVLAGALQVVPLVRVTVTQTFVSPNSFAVIFRWIAGTAMALGGYDAASGASTVIVSPTTSNATNGVPYKYRILTSPHSANRFGATPIAPSTSLPPGLKLDPDPAGTISGTPTQTGTWYIRLMASDNFKAGRTVYANLTLNVVAKPVPKITVQPKSVQVASGTAASFSVTATGFGPFTYDWQFNGASLGIHSTNKLSYASATAAQAGDYQVIVSNSSGSVTSDIVSLVITGPPIITTSPLSQSVTAGAPVTLSVQASGVGPLSYAWSKDGAPITGAQSATYTISNATTADTGDYVVDVTNTYGTTRSDVAHVVVQDLLSFKLILGDSAVSGNKIAFQITGPILTNYVIWSSTDLTNWTPISTNAVTDGVLNFQDAVVNPGQTFYRATLGP